MIYRTLLLFALCLTACTTENASAQCITTLSGSISSTDLSTSDRPTRGGSNPTCAAAKSCPGANGSSGTHYYDTHTLANNTSAPVCVTMTLSTSCGDNAVYLSVYLNSFNPADFCTNYLASPSGSGTFHVTSFIIPANTQFVVVAYGVDNGQTCGDYTIQLNGLSPQISLGTATLAVQGQANCQSTATISGMGTGSKFEITGPGGYVFTNVFRTTGAHSFMAGNITTPGQYKLMVYDGNCATGLNTITVEGTSCTQLKSGHTVIDYDTNSGREY